MRHQTLPATLHVDAPSTHVDWSAGTVSLLTESRRWETDGRPRRAAVSSFGISGTNAHVILEESPPAAAPEPDDVGPDKADDADADTAGKRMVPWLLSARSADALRAQANRLNTFVTEHPELTPVDVGWSLATTRGSMPHRAVVLADDRRSLMTGLELLGRGESAASLIRGTAGGKPRVAYLFTGQGSQRAGMGHELAGAFPVFAAALEETCVQLDLHGGRPVRDLMFAEQGSADADLLDQTDHTQAALFVLEVALFRLLESWGLTPDVMLGHSIGELAAAHVAGVLSLPDAAALVVARGRLMQAARADGAMLSVQTSEAEVLPTLSGREGRIALAAVNGPSSVVLSGDEPDMGDLESHWRGLGVRTRRLRVSHAFHSPHMTEMLADLTEVAGGLRVDPPRIPLISGVTGRAMTAEQLADPGYWATQVSSTVRFAEGLTTVTELGARVLIELGPDAVLAPMAGECLAPAAAGGPAVVPTLRRDRSEVRGVLTALARAHVHGVPVDWPAAFGDRPGRRVDLPLYAFRRRRYWLDAADLVGGVGAVPVEPEVRAEPTWDEAVPDEPRELRQRLSGASAEEQDAVLLALVATHAAAVLEHESPDEVEPERSFLDLGFSSFTALELRNLLCVSTGLALPPVAVYDHPTPVALVGYLRTKLAEPLPVSEEPS